MSPNRYRPKDSKGVRWGKHDDIPPSPKKCPLCGSEMGFSIQNFRACYSSIAGPYIWGSLVYGCDDDECRYRESVRFKTSQGHLFKAVWENVSALEKIMLAPKTNTTVKKWSVRKR